MRITDAAASGSSVVRGHSAPGRDGRTLYTAYTKPPRLCVEYGNGTGYERDAPRTRAPARRVPSVIEVFRAHRAPAGTTAGFRKRAKNSASSSVAPSGSTLAT